MYGAIIVDPTQPLPPADVSYVLVQSEWYSQQVEGTMMTGDYNKMLSVTPDEVVFNGIAFQYNDQPLTAKVGQRVRLYVIDAGPNLSSAFHIIGECSPPFIPTPIQTMHSLVFRPTRSRRDRV
jgi:nitrite reductase (NO-forming)